MVLVDLLFIEVHDFYAYMQFLTYGQDYCCLVQQLSKINYQLPQIERLEELVWTFTWRRRVYLLLCRVLTAPFKELRPVLPLVGWTKVLDYSLRLFVLDRVLFFDPWTQLSSIRCRISLAPQIHYLPITCCPRAFQVVALLTLYHIHLQLVYPLVLWHYLLSRLQQLFLDSLHLLSDSLLQWSLVLQLSHQLLDQFLQLYLHRRIERTHLRVLILIIVPIPLSISPCIVPSLLHHALVLRGTGVCSPFGLYLLIKGILSVRVDNWLNLCL